MWYSLKSRKTGVIKAISKHPSLKDFETKEWKLQKTEDFPIKPGPMEGKETPPAPKKAEPTVRPKFKTSKCAYLMYV